MLVYSLHFSTREDWRKDFTQLGGYEEMLQIRLCFSVTALWNYCSKLKNHTILIHASPLCWWRPPTHKLCRRHAHTHRNVFLYPPYLLYEHTHTHTHTQMNLHTLIHPLTHKSTKTLFKSYCTGAVSYIDPADSERSRRGVQQSGWGLEVFGRIKG